MTSGVALFGVFTSFLANKFLSPREKPQEPVDAPSEGPAARLLELRQLVAEQEKTSAAIREKLQEMEKLLAE